MADFTSATLLRATGWQRSLGGGMVGWLGSVEAEEEEAAGVSGAGGATDWTVAGWWGSVEGLVATADCGQ